MNDLLEIDDVTAAGEHAKQRKQDVSFHGAKRARGASANGQGKRPSKSTGVEPKRQFGMECRLLVAGPERIAMTLRALFAKEVYIRLAEDDNTFLCTVQRGPFRSRPTEVPVKEAPTCLSGPDNEPCSVRRGIFLRMGVVAQSQKFHL